MILEKSECLSYWDHNEPAPPGAKQPSCVPARTMPLAVFYFCSDDVVK